MTTRFRRPMLVLGTTLLVMQAVFMPVGMVYAETTTDTDEQEQVELPPMKNYLEEELVSDPRFFFTRSRMQGTAEEPLQVTFFSDQEVSEARVFLPEEATLLKDQLSTGISVEEGAQPNEWIVQSKRAQNTFVLPLVVEKAGNYELSVEETTAHLEISEQEETSEGVPVEETESYDDDLAGQEEATEEVRIEEEQEKEQAAEEVREPVSEAPQEQQTNEEETDEASQVVEPTVFDGETAEVATMAEFREAVANPAIGIISVQANLTEATANVLTVDRPLLIQGNGYTLTFGNNGFYFQLDEVTQASTIRLENATLTKVGVTPLINATVESSKNWTVELEDITEVNANTMRLASLPEGSIHFTGGVSNFTRTTSAQTFIVAKEVLATNQAEVTMIRGDATVFFSSATVSNPKLTVEQGATVKITTTAGVANTIDLRGENPEVFLQNGELDVATVGTAAAPTDTTNNTIALTGNTPKITMNSSAQLTVRSTLAKRGIHLAGNNAQFLVNNSDLSVTSATQAAINITGESPQLIFDSSVVNVTSTTGQRMNLIGSNPVLNLKNSQLDMNATTGRGIYLQGATPQVIMENSQLLMTDTGASQGIILQGTDALLSLNNESELSITGAGTGALENIQIGNNNARPELSITGESKLSVTTTSGTGAATDTTNNAIHLRGANPKATVTGESVLEVLITSNARRGVYLNGDNPELLVSDSQLDVITVSGQTLNMSGISPKMTMTKSKVSTVSTTGISMTLSGSAALLEAYESEITIRSTTGQRMNLIGSNPVLKLENSQLDMKATTGRGIYLQGEMPQVLVDNSQILMTDTDASQGMILQGTDALLSLSNQSELAITGAGTGTADNIQIGNNNARPELSITGESKVSVTTTSGTGAATVTANNAINLRGSNPKATVTDGSKLEFSIISGRRRSILMNGVSAVLTVDNNSEILSNNFYGTSIGMSTMNAEITVDNFSKINIESSARRNSALIDISAGSNNLVIKNNSSISTKHLEFDNPGGNTRALSMSGSNNSIRITSGGNLDLDNTHHSNRPSSGSTSSGFSTVYLASGNNSFNVDNEGAVGSRSQVRLINDYAAALYSDGGHLTFNQRTDTIFQAEGSSNNVREWGVFAAGDTMEFNVDSPYYFDFKNVRQAGGDIFGTKAGSQLNISNTLFSAWSTGSNFDGDPMIGFFKKIDVSYEGRDFASAASNNNPDLSTSVPGLSGRVSRISANNSKPIFDGIRQPTNADKSFIAEFSYEEGLDGIREAGTDEITAEIKVTDPDNNSKNYTASTVGDESPIQTWEEKEANAPGRAGRILFEFDDLLKEGTIIEFVSISRGSNEDGIFLSEEELELISPITVLNVTPPELVDFGQNINFNTSTTTIEAFPNPINVPGNNALLYINKQFIEKRQVKSDGSFSFELTNELNEGDEVQVLMEDNEGVLIDKYSTIDSVFRRPETNSDDGNRNPLENDYYYHDAIFPKAETYVVELLDTVSPVDPLDPEIEVDPENKPELPEDQGQLSIDFVSSFNFGSQAISVHDQIYYAQPQRLLNEDGTVNEDEERPNYVQVSDRRSENERNGWQLAVTQKEQFQTETKTELAGAQLQLMNQQLVTAQGGKEPFLQATNPLNLIPGNKRTLIRAEGNEGTGTWIYRFGNADTAGESVALHVPKAANPEATKYSTTLVWELSAVPGN